MAIIVGICLFIAYAIFCWVYFKRRAKDSEVVRRPFKVSGEQIVFFKRAFLAYGKTILWFIILILLVALTPLFLASIFVSAEKMSLIARISVFTVTSILIGGLLYGMVWRIFLIRYLFVIDKSKKTVTRHQTPSFGREPLVFQYQEGSTIYLIQGGSLRLPTYYYSIKNPDGSEFQLHRMFEYEFWAQAEAQELSKLIDLPIQLP